MGSRRRAREQALQILYLIDLANTPCEEALRLFRANFDSDEDDFQFVSELIRGIQEHRNELDPVIEEFSENWKLSRMPRIDRNVLRLGAYELKFCLETPTAVIIDEAVELGKKFGEAKTPAFINGILDRISKTRP